MSKSELPSSLKYKLICEFDCVLGLDLDKTLFPDSNLLRDSISERDLLRKSTFTENNDAKKQQLYARMDSQRSALFEKGLVVRDQFPNSILIPRNYEFETAKTWNMVSSSSDVISQIKNESQVDFVSRSPRILFCLQYFLVISTIPQKKPPPSEETPLVSGQLETRGGFLLWAPKAPSSVLPKESGRRRRPVRCPQKKPPLFRGRSKQGGFLLWNYTDI